MALGAADQPPFDPSDDFAPGLGIFALFAIVAILILVGVGIVFAILAIVAVALVAALGTVSSSALLGFYRRRFSTGLRAFHYQICAIAAIPAGIGILWLGSTVFDVQLSFSRILGIGAISGISGGLLVALALDKLSGSIYLRMITPLVEKFTRTTHPKGRIER